MAVKLFVSIAVSSPEDLTPLPGAILAAKRMQIWAKKNHGRSAIPKWNFHKIIIGKDGKVADTFASITKPSSNKFTKKIDQELKN